MNMLVRLDAQVSAVCPIKGVQKNPDGSFAVDYRPEATAEQRAAAQAVIDGFDPSDAAHAAWEDDQQPQRKALRQQATQAVSDNDTFLAIANPTNAQVLAQVRALTRQNSAIIRRLIQID